MAEKIYFKIGEVAKRFNVNTSLIRYWEREFDFIRPKKSQKGTRLYSKKDIERFEIIHHLVKEKGLTIKGAQDFIKAKKENREIDKIEVINTLKKTQNLLKEVRKLIDS
ncbi:MAG TPA: MerR family transcriptional regulator [Bacteroidales bacterium]